MCASSIFSRLPLIKTTRYDENNRLYMIKINKIWKKNNVVNIKYDLDQIFTRKSYKYWVRKSNKQHNNSFFINLKKFFGQFFRKIKPIMLVCIIKRIEKRTEWSVCNANKKSMFRHGYQIDEGKTKEIPHSR